MTYIIITLYALIISYFVYLFVWMMLEREDDKKSATAYQNFWIQEGLRRGRLDSSGNHVGGYTHDGRRYVPSHRSGSVSS
jgi:hypothetical protein